ncbi:MAG TPA: tetratricopeptide repeat protein [Verrucomicrobiota bacterium]|nr:tetratricopeptide repeat protein [Verrucomicrobiota bacterium]
MNSGTDIQERSVRRRKAGLSAVLVLLVFAAYWPALRGQFVWDDRLLIDKNPIVTGQHTAVTVWFQTDFPLSTVCFWIQWLAWGDNAAGYHCVNVLVHALNCLLLWRVLALAQIRVAWVCAAIFAVHPVCAASVAWISELKNTLSLAFFLVSFGCYLKSSAGGNHSGATLCAQPQDATANKENRSPTTGFRIRSSGFTHWYWLSLTAFVLALLSKTSTVMLPVALLIWTWWRRGAITRRDTGSVSPFLALSLAFGLMSVWFQKHQAMAGTTVQTEGLVERIALAGKAVWFYLGKAVFPVNLNFIYPRWELDNVTVASLLPLCLLGVVILICWKSRSAWGRHALFALAFFVVNLLPALGLLDMYYLAISRVADHFMYISLIAPAALAGAGLGSFLNPRLFRAAAAGLIAVLTLLTFQRSVVIASERSLWHDTLAKNPAAWTAHNNLGVVAAEQGDLETATRHFEQSLGLNPRNAAAHINLGRALAMRNDFPQAERHFLSALELKPLDTDASLHYAQTLAAQGRVNEALSTLNKALSFKPDLQLRLSLAAMLRQTGDTRGAIEQYREVIRLKSDSAEAHNNLAWMLATTPDDALRDGTEAVQHAERACRLTQFRDAGMVGTLAAAYAASGRYSDAVATAQKAADLADAAGQTQFAALNRQLLELYRAGIPYREPANR